MHVLGWFWCLDSQQLPSVHLGPCPTAFSMLQRLLISYFSYRESRLSCYQTYKLPVFLTENPVFPIRNLLLPAKNPDNFWTFLLRSCFRPYFLLGIWHFSIFLVGKVRTCTYLPPPTFPDKFLNRILVTFLLVLPGTKQELVKSFGIRFTGMGTTYFKSNVSYIYYIYVLYYVLYMIKRQQKTVIES